MKEAYSLRSDREPAPNRLFFAIIITYLAVSAVFTAFSMAGQPLRLPTVLNLISGELTLLVPALIYLVLTRTNVRRVSERWGLPLAAVPLLVLLAYCILPLISLINLGSMILGGENAAASLGGTVARLPLWLSLLCVSILPGIVEEFIFRGLLYGTYRKRGAWKAVLVSALLFGLMHMNLNQFCYAFVMGIIFALLYEATGSLTAPILVHAVYNGNSVLVMHGTADAADIAGAQEMLLGMLSDGGPRTQLLITVLILAVTALVGLAAAGGLYVAIVKLCRREKQVGILFAGTSDRKIAVFRQRQGKAEGEEISRRIWGPFLIAGTAVSVLAILGRALLLQLA